MHRIDHLISVIVPIYNTAQYLPRCIESIINNTYRNLEIICVNDGSTDESANILNEYASKDSRIIVICKENGGVSSARNAGLDICTGAFVSFVDSDDAIHPQFFEALMYFQVLSDAAIINCPLSKLNKEEKLDRFDIGTCATTKYTFSACLDTATGNKGSACGKLYRRDLVNNRYFDTNAPLSEDTLYNTMLYVEYPEYVMLTVQNAMYYYYLRGGSRSYSAPAAEGRKYLADCYLKLIEKTTSPKVQELLTIEILKCTFAYRYLAMFYADKKQITLEADRRISMGRHYLRNSKGIPMRVRVRYELLACFPSLYRAWRIYNDPTMLQWEKAQKQRIAKVNE